MNTRPQADRLPAATRFPIEAVRNAFPALERAAPFVFFDNGGGSQVPQNVIDAVNEHLLERNVQRGGRYTRSMAVDAMLERARASVAALINARDPAEICFGMNATSFIRLVSLAIAQSLKTRNEFVVTDLDHEGNIATWLALAPQGAQFKWWRMRDDGRLHTADLAPLLSERTRLVACTAASNVLGSLVDVRAASDLAHAAGAEIFIDCVHLLPHAQVDVRALDCDYLVCSAYKTFAPHLGFLWGRFELLERLPTFREDFIPDRPPAKVEAGTLVYENVAGMDAAVRYLEQLGGSLDGSSAKQVGDARRADLARALAAIREYELTLSREMLRVLKDAGAQVYGVSDPARVEQRVPTFCFNVARMPPAQVTEAVHEAGIGIRDGHLYAPRMMKRLGLSLDSGAVRVSLVHYNTVEEIHRFGNVLRELR
jgi:cysteine desulfurase family protein (TIGR01976 family)